MKKIERLIALIYQLKRYKHLRAKKLAELLGTTERTVYRDIVSLNEAFQDYVQIIGTEKGYSIDDTMYAPPIRLIPDEYAALETAVNAMAESNPHYQLAHQALSKLACQFQLPLDPTHIENTLAVMQPTPKDCVHPQRLQELQKILQEKRQLKLSYYSHHSQRTKEIIFDAYSLIFRKYAWYLIGKDATKANPILLRVCRIRTLQVLDSSFHVPRDFSVRRYFQNHWEVFDGEPVDVTLRFREPAALLIEEMRWHSSQKNRRLSEQEIEVHLHVPTNPEFITWILGWGAQCEVVEPAALKQRIRDEVLQLSQSYAVI
ncbi:MAG: helix-turn-helix transcriptional regulator [Candidatus Sericytochromatia bacterium]